MRYDQLMKSTIFVAGLAAWVAVSPAAAQRYEISGSDVAVYNLAGDVTIRPGSGSAVVVAVETGGGDAGRLAVETGAVRGRETLRVIYPDRRIRYPGLDYGETTLRVRDDGTFGDSHDDWRGNRGERVTITGRGGGLDAHANLTISVPRGQRIAVYLGAGHVDVGNVDGDLEIDTSSGTIETRGTTGSLNLDTGSGSVDVRGAGGDVRVDTGSGGVQASDVNGQVLNVDTGSGSVYAANVAVSTLEIDTGSGRIQARAVSARDIRLDTGSGSIELELLSDADDMEIDTGSGSVTLTVPESFGARVEIETGSGGIELDMPITTRSWQRDHVTGTIGDGRGRLVIDTGSGSVRIRHPS